MRIKNLSKIITIHNGISLIYKFKNKYGASVVKHHFSYGNKQGLWELAVLDSKGDLDYSTIITDDVIGNLSDKGVDEILNKISKLKK